MASELCCVEDVRLRGILLEKFIEVAKVSEYIVHVHLHVHECMAH